MYIVLANKEQTLSFHGPFNTIDEANNHMIDPSIGIADWFIIEAKCFSNCLSRAIPTYIE